jgi:hypothetical protein
LAFSKIFNSAFAIVATVLLQRRDNLTLTVDVPLSALRPQFGIL